MVKKIAAALAVIALSGCVDSDDKQNEAQETLNAQAVSEVGMPAITRFSEKRQLRDIFELRDKAVTTKTYIVDLNGRLHKICDSIGYGIPYATQYTSPQKYSASGGSLPQADPNGLYSPASADGTWVLCQNPKDKTVSPMYVEPHVIVSRYPLPEAK